MANKRFLGLGFTFAATDKGLLKHLKQVQDSLSQISGSLDDINGIAPKTKGAIKGLGDAPKPKSKSSPMAGKIDSPIKESTTKIKAVVEREEKQVEKYLEAVNQGLIKSFDQGFVKELESFLDKETLKQFTEDMNKLTVKVDEAGYFSERYRKDLIKSAVAFQKFNEENNKYSKAIKKLSGDIGDYISNVGKKTENFFQSLGVDLRSMIPPQLSALGGVVGAVLKMPLMIGKSIFGSLRKMFRPTQSEKIMKKFSAQLGGTGTGKSTVYGILQKIHSVLGKKGGDEGGGFWDILKAGLVGAGVMVAGWFTKALSPVAKVASWFKELKIVKNVISWFKELKAVKAIASVFSKITNLFKAFDLGKIFLGPFGKIMAKGAPKLLGILAGPVGLLILAVDAIYSSITGFMKAFDEGGTLFEKIGKGILYSIDNFLGGLPSLLLEGISKAVSFVSKGAKEFFSNFSVSDIVSGAASKILPFSNSKTETPTAKSFPSQGLAKDVTGEQQVSALANILSEMRRGNDLSREMVDKLSEKNGKAGLPISFTTMKNVVAPKGNNGFDFASEGQAY